MHISFLHKDFPYSGAETVTIAVANYLCQTGYKVTVLVINHHENSYPSFSKRLFKIHLLPKANIKMSGKVAQAIKHFIIDEKVNVLITYREIFYAHWLKRETGVKLVFELHNTLYYECLDIKDKRRESKWKNFIYGCGVEKVLKAFYRKKYARIYRWCDAFVLLCEGYKNNLIGELSLDLNDNKAWVIPNPIQYPNQITLDKQQIVIYVGRLTNRDKRVDRLLRIWKIANGKMPGWQLKIVGSGKYAGKLKQISEEMDLRNVTFEGFSQNVKKYYDEASILCLTSTFEGWPMCVAEAQANGVIPIIYNSFEGATDLINHSDEGILVTPFDEQLFASQLIQLANNPTRQKNMQSGVIRKAKKYNILRSGFAWEEMIRNITCSSHEK